MRVRLAGDWQVASVGILVLTFIGAAPAAPPPAPLAIVVGNDLGGAGDPPLQFASRDAQRVARVLRELGGVERAGLELLLNRDKQDLEQVIERVVARLEGMGGTLIFYYSGHAGDDGLHIGSEVLPWSELTEVWQRASNALRITFLDTCHSGMATRAKGFSISAAEIPRVTGFAILAAAGSTEAAHETKNLGGSFFSHYLLSGMRGAADADGDHRVSVSELQTYVSRATRQATARWAPSVQNPEYRFDLQGARDAVLTDLGRSDSSLIFDDTVAGQLLVVSRSTGAIVTDMVKVWGSGTLVAIPPDRYLILVRSGDEVMAGEVELGWGGHQVVGVSDLVVQNPLTVARKGTRVVVRPHRLAVGVELASPPLKGAEWSAGPVLGYRYLIGEWELGVRASGSFGNVETGDVNLNMWRAGLHLEVGHAWYAWLGDLRLFVSGGAELWRQSWQQVVRTAAVPTLAVGGSVRAPMVAAVFVEPSVSGTLSWPRTESAGYQARLAVALGLQAGLAF